MGLIVSQGTSCKSALVYKYRVNSRMVGHPETTVRMLHCLRATWLAPTQIRTTSFQLADI